jgi:hypothetical protein
LTKNIRETVRENGINKGDEREYKKRKKRRKKKGKLREDKELLRATETGE